MKKKNLLIIFVISIIVLIGIVIGIIFFATDIFKPNSKLFWKYFSKVSNISTELLSSKEQKIQNDFKKNNTYMSNGELLLSVKQGENSTKQLKINTTQKHDVNTGRTYSNATLKNGDLNIFNVSYINSGDIYAIKCDEVTPIYVGISNTNLQELAKKYKVDYLPLVPNMLDSTAFTSLLDFTSEQEKYLIDTYMPIVTNNISEEQYIKKKEKIKIGERVHNINMYSVKLSGDSIKKILLDLLNNLKSDNEILAILSAKFANLQLGSDYTDITNLSTKIIELIKYLEEVDIQNELNISVYEEKGETIKIIIEVPNIVKLEYDIIDNKNKLIVEIQNISNKEENSIDEDSDKIIDLTPYKGDKEEQNIARITIERESLENSSLIKAKLVPNTNKEDRNIYAEINMSNIQNNSFNNKLTLTANLNNNGKSKAITVNYDNKITKTNEVEEITELNSSNTVIANNYDAKQFSAFITNYYQMFINKFIQKLKTLGFEILYYN